MVDYIKREDCLGILMCLANYPCGMNGVKKMVSSIPSADVVSVVRCRDCKHYDEESEECKILDSNGFSKNDYCSLGERKL